VVVNLKYINSTTKCRKLKNVVLLTVVLPDKKKTSFHCFPANLELNLQWKEALINHAGSTISMIFFLVKRPFRFVFQQMLNVLLNIFQQIAFCPQSNGAC
jgi:hypothetical protein